MQELASVHQTDQRVVSETEGSAGCANPGRGGKRQSKGELSFFIKGCVAWRVLLH